MALGFNYSTGSAGLDIIPFIKYDARAGRIFRVDRVEDQGSFVSDQIDITANFRAVFDMEHLEIGYLLFTAGLAPAYVLAPLGSPRPEKPADGRWKQGVRVMLKLNASCGGDIRELTSNAAAFLRGFDQLHTEYEAEKAKYPGKLPVVILHSTIPVTTGSGSQKSTAYQPVFKIDGWAPRPKDLIHKPKTNSDSVAASVPSNGHGVATAPTTGSTAIGPPIAAVHASPAAAAADDDFG